MGKYVVLVIRPKVNSSLRKTTAFKLTERQARQAIENLGNDRYYYEVIDFVESDVDTITNL